MQRHCWRGCAENKPVALTVGAVGGSGVPAANRKTFGPGRDLPQEIIDMGVVGGSGVRAANRITFGPGTGQSFLFGPGTGLPRWGLLLACCLIGGRAWAAGLPDTIDQIRASIVGIGTVQKDKRQVKTTFSGTGFVVGDGTRIVTNYHVYKGLKKVPGSEMAVFSGRGESARVRPVKLDSVDKAHDLALLRLKVGRLPPLKLAGDNFLREGEAVAFTGFPIGVVLGLYPVTHRGMVSAITPIVIPSASAKKLTAAQIKRLRNKRFEVYQLDGTAYPGNSGSPVYKIDTGEVIGVINSVFVKGTKEAVLEKPSGISYAIPVKYVRRLLQKK